MLSKRPNKTLERLRSQVPLQETETYIGAFMGRTGIKWGWFILIGPLVVCTMKQYQVMVTNKRVIIGKLSLFGAIKTIDPFPFQAIRAIILKKGICLQRPPTIESLRQPQGRPGHGGFPLR